jgi:hypothetical protein
MLFGRMYLGTTTAELECANDERQEATQGRSRSERNAIAD